MGGIDWRRELLVASMHVATRNHDLLYPAATSPMQWSNPVWEGKVRERGKTEEGETCGWETNHDKSVGIGREMDETGGEIWGRKRRGVTVIGRHEEEREGK